MKIISYIQDDNFNTIIIPKLLKINLYNKYKKLIKDKKIKSINNYLELNFKLIFIDILNVLLNNIHIYNVNDKTVLTIENNVKIKEYNLDTLLRLIDFGNLEFKGLNLFNTAFKSVQNNLNIAYKIYLKGGFNFEC